MNMQTGVIESSAAVPLAEALARWRIEAQVGEIRAAGHRSPFFAWGRGQPLLLVHGISDRARSFVPLIAHLTSSFRCIAIELPPRAMRHADLVAVLFAALDELRIGQACLYGASFGSTVVLSALHAQPRRFLRAAMHGAFAHRRLAPAERFIVNLARHWPGRLGGVPFFHANQRRRDFGPFADREPALWDFLQANTGSTRILAFARRAALLATLDLRPLLPAIHHPVMLISGDRDTHVAHAGTEELARTLPHADQLEFADCGHMPQYSHAAALAETLRRFLLPPCGMTG